MRPAPAHPPACLHLDVEPDGFQIPPGGAPAWSGFVDLLDVVRAWKDGLAREGLPRPRVGWYLRMDPQIEATEGRRDAVARRFAEAFAALRDEGDEFGTHLHPLRWSPADRLWVHDVSDPRWIRDAVERSLDAFETWTGAPALHYRAGAGFLTEDIVDVLDQRGVVAEWSLEPMAKAAPYTSEIPTGVDTSPVRGEAVDCAGAPHEPYRPAHGDFRRIGGDDARRLTIVPVTTAPRRLPPTGLGHRVRRLLRRPAKPRSVRVLYPSSDRPGPRTFWDLVAHRVTTSARPYVSLGVRSDAPRSAPARHARAVLAALRTHPVRERLRWVTPSEALASLTRSGGGAPAAGR